MQCLQFSVEVTNQEHFQVYNPLSTLVVCWTLWKVVLKEHLTIATSSLGLPGSPRRLIVLN